MDLIFGFSIDDPAAFIPWDITQAKLRECLGDRLRVVRQGHYAISCVTLGGMSHELAFHFEPRQSDRLVELEFFRGSYVDPAGSFHEFQRYFERAFGAAIWAQAGAVGFYSYEWVLPGVRIYHSMSHKFGLEERLSIRRSMA